MVDTIPPGTIPLLCEVGCHSSHSRNRWLFQRARTWREWFIWPDGATVIIWCELPDNLIRIGKSRLLVPWCLFWWESGEVLIERELALVYSGYTCSMMCFPLFFLDREHCAWILLTFIYKDFRPWEGQGREAGVSLSRFGHRKTRSGGLTPGQWRNNSSTPRSAKDSC